MGKPKKPRGGSRQPEKKTPVLDRLKPDEATTVLRRLLEARPGLKAEAEQIAKTLLIETSFESVADEVEWAVRTLDIDDLNSYAASHPLGYIEPTEAAWELLEEAVEPFFEDMRRNLELALTDKALEICKGVVFGLYNARDVKDDELLAWAPDFQEEMACSAIETWHAEANKIEILKQGARKPLAFPRNFIEKDVPEWASPLESLIRTHTETRKGSNHGRKK